MSEYSDRVRREWGMLTSIRQAELRQPDDVLVARDIPYREPVDFDKRNGWNLLDVYRPKNQVKKIPVIISFHGGSYIYGTKEMYQHYLMSIAQRGFAVVNFNYRLAPEVKFPHAFEDANDVIRWVKAHAAEYDFDLENVFMIGDSVGAHYVSLYTLLCINPSFQDLIEVYPEKGFVPKGLGLNCGIFKINWFFYLVNDFVLALEDIFGEKAVSKRKAVVNGKSVKIKKLMNVSFHMTKDFPPAFVMTGAYDFVRFQTKYMKRLLKKYKIRHISKVYGTKSDKDTIHNFHANLDCTLSKICNDEECNFFKSLM